MYPTRFNQAGPLVRVLLLLAAAVPVLAFSVASPQQHVTTAPATRPFAPSVRAGAPISASSSAEILVKFAPDFDPRAAARVHARLQGTVVGRIPALGVQVVRVPAERLQETLEAYAHTPGVVYAEPNYPVRAFFTPNDPLFPQQWNLQLIHAPEAWDLSRGDNVTIAIVDTGVNRDHPDLRDKLVPGYDFVNDDDTPWDDNGHGTFVALIAAAATNNHIGIAGVGCNAKVMPVKALNAWGVGTHASVAAAIVWATDHGADVINLSLGGPYPSHTLSEAVEYAWNQGVVLVAAVGNEASSIPAYPAAYPVVMAVTGVTAEAQRARFANYGQYISVAAPGGAVFPGNGWEQPWRGTSLAAPHVAGVAALVASANPALNNEQIRTFVEETAQDLGAPGWDPYFGHGLVDAYRAVMAAISPESVIASPQSMTSAINTLRRAHGQAPLRPVTRLMGLAQRRLETFIARCAAMADPEALASCLTQSARADEREAFVVGADTAEQALQMLLGSARGRNLLLGPYWALGVGTVVVEGNARPRVWLLRFGRNRTGTLNAPSAEAP